MKMSLLHSAPPLPCPSSPLEVDETDLGCATAAAAVVTANHIIVPCVCVYCADVEARATPTGSYDSFSLFTSSALIIIVTVLFLPVLGSWMRFDLPTEIS